MIDTLLKFLGQFACVTAKELKTPAYQTDKQIFATAPLQLVSLDLFVFDDVQYSIIMDIFSKLLFVFRCSDKRAETIAAHYSNWVSMYDEPEIVLCDNGTDFNTIPSKKLTTNIKMSDYEAQDFEKMDYFKLKSIEEDNVRKFNHRNISKYGQ